ncbi:MAG: hypothetical protein ACFE8B_00450 [Candidatus Hermodarchaeota archaeon]
MDFKDFHNGLLSLALTLLMFALTLMISSFVLKPYINSNIEERNCLILLSSGNIIFSIYCLWEFLKLKKTFKLENKNIIKFGKRIGIITVLYFPHLVFTFILLLGDLHSLVLIIIFLIFIIECILTGLIFKETYDLVFLEETRRDIEIEENRMKYFEQI